MGAPSFAVVVVNYRSARDTVRCVEAAVADGPAEVVVVDNASQDGSVEALRAQLGFATIVARPANDGFAAGVNAGVEHTSSPVVVLLNPDTLPARGALRRLAEHLGASPRAGVAAPRLTHEDGRPQPSAYRRDPGLATLFLDLCLPLGWLAQRVPSVDPYRLPPARWRDGAAVAHATGAALAVRRDAYLAAGPFDEEFFLYLEETEWQQRVRRAGFTIELVASAEVVHHVRGGGTASLAPSPYFLASMRRYLARRGRPKLAVEAAIDTALLLSRAAARLEPLVIPGERRTAGARALAYDELWRARKG